MNEDTDAKLQRLAPRAAEGDHKALRDIIRLIHPLVLRYARARLGSYRTPTPEDVAQEVCLAVVTAIGRYRDRGRPFMAFVYSIASNKVADAHRALARDKTTPTDDVPELDAHLGAQPNAPEISALAQDSSNRVRRLLDSLDERPREIVILRVIVGLSANETAAALDTTAGAVRVAQHRALAKLRELVELEQEEGHG